MGDKKIPRIFWILAEDNLPITCIDAPPEIWQDKVTGDRVHHTYYHKFIKVVEVPDERAHDASWGLPDAN